MNVTVGRTGPKLTDAELNRFEDKHACKIPVAYRKFLLVYNGGHPDPSDFKMGGGSGREDQIGSVKQFLGINVPEKTLDVGYVLDVFRDRIPSYLFPIARDPGGNLICIVNAGESLGQILFWDHEQEAEEGVTPTDRNLYFIASTFDKFLDSLGNG